MTAQVIQGKENRENGNKKLAFFEKNYAFFFAPIIVFTIYLLQLYTNGVFPFDDKYTVASYDLSAQIAPFIEHLFDVINGKSTLSYSYAIAGGADVTGTFLYFFISPFSFLFLLFGEGRVAHATGFVMLAKLMAIAFSGTWFAKKLFKNIPDYLCVGIGVAYTYCGYTFVANTYIVWMDFLIYLPFCVGAFKKFVQTGKYMSFSVLMSCCIYTCFSIACFSMFTVFPALIVYAILCVEKENRFKFIAYLCLSFVFALLFSLPVLLPALGSFLRSARSGGLFENIWNGFTMADGIPIELKGTDFIADMSTAFYKKWSYILSDGIFVILTLIWFYRHTLKEAFVKFMLIVGVFTLLPTVVDEAMLLMNMGSYMQYSLRFGFLNALYFLGGACLCLNELSYAPEKAEKIIVKEPKAGGRVALSKKTATVIFLVIGAIATAFLLYFISGNRYKGSAFWSLFTSDSSELKSLKGFSSSFAHTYGGLEVVLVFFAVIGIVLIAGALLVENKKITVRLVSVVMIILVGLQVCFYNNQLVVGNLSTQHTHIDYYQTLSETLNEQDDGYFRIKDYGEINSDKERVDMWTSNVPFTGNSNSFSVFSSMIDRDNFIIGPLFGYLNNGKNSLKSAHNTHGNYNRSDVFGDSFLGYKYFFVSEKHISDVEKKSYVKKVLLDGEHLSVTTDENPRYRFYVYENTAVFPFAYRVNGTEPFRFVAENSGSENRKKNHAKLYEFLRGENLKTFTGNSEVKVENAVELSQHLWSRAAEIEVGTGKITARVQNAQAGESLFLNFVASKGYNVTVNGKKATLIDNDLKFLQVALEEGENVVEFSYQSPYVWYIGIGIVLSAFGTFLVWWIATKTKFMLSMEKVIAWAGIGIATVVVALFMLFPTCVWLTKWFFLIV